MTATARQPRKLDIETFLAFYETRPDEEQWQLIDGVALLMTPPFIVHQRIASNLERLLNNALELHLPHLSAIQRIGIELPEFPHYRPEPDVAVIDRDIPLSRRYVDRFYLAAEVLSDSDEDRVDLKRGFYRANEHNRIILLIRQDAYEVEVDRRGEGSSWMKELLRGQGEVLLLPEFGLACRVGDLYRDVQL